MTGTKKLTFPVVVFPPESEVGEKLTAEGAKGPTVKDPYFVSPLKVAEIFTGVETVTWFV